MAYNQFVTDLKNDALFRAGEPINGQSSFEQGTRPQVIEYLNRILQQLVLGSGVAAGRDLATSAGIYARLVQPPVTDWWWARKRGVVTTTPFVTLANLNLVNGSTNVSGLAITAAPSHLKSRIHVEGARTAPIIVEHTASNFEMDAPWPEDNATGVGADIVQYEYDLPVDFLRFAQMPSLHSDSQTSISVAALEQRDMEFPVPSKMQGTPTRAYIVGPKRIALNAYDDKSYRLEFEYIHFPTNIMDGDEPPLPEHHRPILSVGAAMLMLLDKNDGRAQNLASEFREMLDSMGTEQRQTLISGSGVYGQFRFRQPGTRTRSRQSTGELYLV